MARASNEGNNPFAGVYCSKDYGDEPCTAPLDRDGKCPNPACSSNTTEVNRGQG